MVMIDAEWNKGMAFGCDKPPSLTIIFGVKVAGFFELFAFPSTIVVNFLLYLICTTIQKNERIWAEGTGRFFFKKLRRSIRFAGFTMNPFWFHSVEYTLNKFRSKYHTIVFIVKYNIQKIHSRILFPSAADELGAALAATKHCKTKKNQTQRRRGHRGTQRRGAERRYQKNLKKSMYRKNKTDSPRTSAFSAPLRWKRCWDSAHDWMFPITKFSLTCIKTRRRFYRTKLIFFTNVCASVCNSQT